MLNLFRLLMMAGCLFVTVSSVAGEQDNHLVRFCDKPGLTVKEEIYDGDAVRVSLHRGTRMRMVAGGHSSVREQLADELKHLGVTQTCASYFLAQGRSSEGVSPEKPLPEKLSPKALSPKTLSLQKEKGNTAGRVYFHFDSHMLTPASVAVLDRLLAKIQADSRIVLAGNTDATGPDGYNFSLGLKRAASVRRYLTQHHIDKKQTQVISYGENHPVAGNSSSQGRQQNRRVDIVVYEQ
ncbi:Peptidoglycan-binding protein ArfA [Vibrio aerogenes CECT 7868]|uniref:Peptidoglycan-binding protein ArfA n=1 Tax=Vibrio aerogenes CECT 7868 TaxID=1216006 RepID=A0A1M5ZRM7_9VIBR|nr:OmpA family protein [Vibrio aerogenes]SHI26818.1 Peptidoglycan-binding protein ArfA [Vibrio aerogenes CECT 7868]